MNRRDVTTSTVAAALGAVALLSVQAVMSRARGNANANAGKTRLADSAPATPTTDRDDRDPAMLANANLSDQVQRYKERLDAIGAEKAATEKQLAEAQRKPATTDLRGPGTNTTCLKRIGRRSRPKGR